jgi:uncharacterized protein (DUF2235 family)
MPTHQPASGRRLKQRLVLCLDSTWSDRADCSAVFQIANQVTKGAVVDDRGRSIGQLTHLVAVPGPHRILWAPPRLGADAGVRGAYAWLVEQCHDEGPDPDEIFMFGVGRGALAAAVLVGFLADFGLLQRGAPLDADAFWAACQSDQDGRARALPRCRRIGDLKADPWEGGAARSEPANDLERSLVAWSRRVRIRYLGLFDAVPGRGEPRGMRPSSIVQACRHALAIDEHRAPHATVAARHDGIDPGRQGWHPPSPRARPAPRWVSGRCSGCCRAPVRRT